MRSTKRSIALAAATACGLAACTGIRVDTDYDPNADFASLETYSWMERKKTGNPRLDNDLLHQRVRRAVDAQLREKGYGRVVSDADFLVVEHFVIEKQTDVNTYVSSYGYRLGPVYTETYVDQYEVGTVILDVVNADTRQMMWRGSAEGRIHENMTPEQRAERARVVAEKLLADFPPEP